MRASLAARIEFSSAGAEITHRIQVPLVYWHCIRAKESSEVGRILWSLTSGHRKGHCRRENAKTAQQHFPLTGLAQLRGFVGLGHDWR